MLLRENELARRHPGGIDLRPEAIRVRWEFADLVTADGHELRCTFSAGVRCLDDRTEIQVLEEVLLSGRNALFAEDVARHFYSALRAAAARVAQAHDAKAWFETDEPKRAMADALKTAAISVAFACGLEMLPPFQADLQSPTFERQRVAALQQVMAEKAAAGQIERLAHAAELLKQFQTLRGAAPELSAGQVLERVSAADRGALMQAMLLAGAKQQAGGALWAVAGPYLVRIDIGKTIEPGTPPTSQLIPLPPTLGPLRSIQAEEIDGRRMLLVGAQYGFFLAPEEDLSHFHTFRDAGYESPLGFNGVIYWPQRRQFCATHSEAGLVCWDVDAPDAPAKIMRPAALGILPRPMPELQSMGSMNLSIRGSGGLMGPRNLQRLNGDTLIFTAGGRIITWDGNSIKTIRDTGASEIIILLAQHMDLQVVHEDGTAETVDTAGKPLGKLQRLGKVRSAGTLPWMGASRLLLAADDGPVQCLGFDDPVVTQYFSAHRGLRAIAASATLVAGVSPDRQRLVLWNSWEGRQPAAEVFIGAQARHRIADIAFS